MSSAEEIARREARRQRILAGGKERLERVQSYGVQMDEKAIESAEEKKNRIEEEERLAKMAQELNERISSTESENGLSPTKSTTSSSESLPSENRPDSSSSSSSSSSSQKQTSNSNSTSTPTPSDSNAISSSKPALSLAQHFRHQISSAEFPPSDALSSFDVDKKEAAEENQKAPRFIVNPLYHFIYFFLLAIFSIFSSIYALKTMSPSTSIHHHVDDEEATNEELIHDFNYQLVTMSELLNGFRSEAPFFPIFGIFIATEIFLLYFLKIPIKFPNLAEGIMAKIVRLGMWVFENRAIIYQMWLDFCVYSFCFIVGLAIYANLFE